MIEIEIQDMLRIEHALLSIRPGTVNTVTGGNEAGKTSIATLVGGILCRNENPLGHGRKPARLYLKDYADSGFCQLKLDDQPIARWDAVSGEIQDFDVEQNLLSTPGPVGLVDFCASITPAARVALWEGYFLPPLPDLKDKFQKVLKPHLSEGQLEQIIELVGTGEMKSVCNAYENRRKNAKAEWKMITGEDYGMAKGTDWIPAGWSADMDGLTEALLREEIEVAQSHLRNVQVVQAITAADIEKAAQVRARIKVLHKQKVENEKSLEKLEEKSKEMARPLAEIQKHMRGLEGMIYAHNDMKPRAEATKKCGACGVSLIHQVQGKTMPPYDVEAFARELKLWEQKKVELQNKYDRLDGERQEIAEKIEPVARQLHVARNEISRINVEINALRGDDALADSTPTVPDDGEESEKAEKALEHARYRHQLFQRREQARRHHHDVMAYDEVVKALGPKGVRATEVDRSMNVFRKVLERVQQITDWSATEIDAAYNISIGGRKFLKVAGETPRLRAQYAIQIALAVSQKEQLVVLDMVDHLEQRNQEILKELLVTVCTKQKNPPAFLLCGTTGHFSKETFDSPVIGNSYELGDGKLHAV